MKFFNRSILAKLLGLPVESVRYLEGDVGGAFGARGEFYPEDFVIPSLAAELGRPVKWVEDRRENLIPLNQAREQDWEIEMAANPEGKLLAFRARGVFNQGAYARTHGSVLLPMLMINHLPGPYRWGAYEIEASSSSFERADKGAGRTTAGGTSEVGHGLLGEEDSPGDCSGPCNPGLWRLMEG